ncbi:MAG: hypothetical protein H5U38_10330 [Calditrichaeota bacterium]|nr:hypothetical protein [Calditrichota bacterium]
MRAAEMGDLYHFTGAHTVTPSEQQSPFFCALPSLEFTNSYSAIEKKAMKRLSPAMAWELNMGSVEW